MRVLIRMGSMMVLGMGAAAQDVPRAVVLQGGIARWSGMDAKECGIFGKRYDAIEGVCYYPVDMDAKKGIHEVALYAADGKQTLGALDVRERECTETTITLEKTEYVDVSEENRQRAVTERQAELKAIAGDTAAEPHFKLPLRPPANGVATKDRSDFCERRLYNDKIRSRHTGLDYPVSSGTDVIAPANGRVVLAGEHFYPGKAVFIDHGAGMTTNVFHLSEIAVETGDTVLIGDVIGKAGDTGRTTGPHLHFGARWLGQRIDAGALLGDPAKLPGVGEPATASAPDTQTVKADADTPASEDQLGEE
jgi:murein DD-endopeptidase MepM/ murein hydrolase activator NlpD